MNRLQVKTVIAFAAVYIVWGSTFYGVSIALKSFPPFLLASLRFLVGGLALACYCYLKSERLPSAKEILNLSWWGIVIFGGGVISVVWAQQYLPSSLASIVITTPFWFIVLDKSQWKTNFRSPWIIFGLVSGVVGVALLLSQRPSSQLDGISFTHTKSILVMIGGSLLWVAGSLHLRNNQNSVSTYTKTAIHLLAASAFSLVVAYFSNELAYFDWSKIRADAVCALLFLSIISTTMTFMAFVWLLQTKPAVIVSTYSYVNPIVAVLLGVFLGGESINTFQLFAMVIILAGILFVNIPKYKLS